MKKVRISIVGLGNMGNSHATSLLAGLKSPKKLVAARACPGDFAKSFGR